jgi:hypothetical protein
MSHMYSTAQYSTVQYSTAQYSTVQYSTVQYSTVQHSTVQYSTRYSCQTITKLQFPLQILKKIPECQIQSKSVH